jgi:hypothetical protein
MAIYDALFVFSDDQLITGDAISTNVLDWGSGLEDLDIAVGDPLYLNVAVADADFAGGTSLAVQIYTHSTTTINSGVALMTSETFLQAALTAGAPLISMTLPLGADRERYFGLYYDDTGAFSAGGIDAWIGHHPIGMLLQPNTQVAPSNI